MREGPGQWSRELQLALVGTGKAHGHVQAEAPAAQHPCALGPESPW